MGQAVRKNWAGPSSPWYEHPAKLDPLDERHTVGSTCFPDLDHLPPEVALSVLSHLNATDLCLAACVWQHLASDEILWSNLCRRQWGDVSVYRRPAGKGALPSKKLYLLLDEGTLTFNSDPHQGMRYFFDQGLVDDSASEIATFFHHTSMLCKSKMRQYLETRHDVLKNMTELQNFENAFLPNALRRFFSKLEAPNDRGQYLQTLLNSFAIRFVQCNPQLSLTVDAVYVLCFSLILLSVDLASPHVKNKMSKREFIRNTRNAMLNAPAQSDVELLGQMYDNIFLRGPVSGEASAPTIKNQRFIPGYLAIFL